MKAHSKNMYGFIALITTVLLFTGCAPQLTHILNTSEIPMLQTGSPLMGLESKTFAFNAFKDIRNVSFVKQIRNHTFVLDQPPANIVAMWIKKELERSGHICITNAPHVKADFVVDGAIFKYSSIGAGSAMITSTSNIGVILKISHIPSSLGIFEKSYEGVHRVTGVGGDEWKISLQQTLPALLKEISTDDELIEFIRK